MTFITGQQLADELRALGFEEVHTPRDTSYACPSLLWLAQFGKYCLANQPAKPGSGQESDCDDSADWAVDQARRSANANPDCKGHGHPVCYCEVRIPLVTDAHEDDGEINDLNGIEGPQEHSTTIVRCDDGKLYFFEPQTGRFMDGDEAVRAGRVSACVFVRP